MFPTHAIIAIYHIFHYNKYKKCNLKTGGNEMKRYKKLLQITTLASIAILSIASTSFAAMNETAARELAEKWVPEGSIYTSMNVDDHEYEVEFFHKATNEKYEVEISKLTEKVTEVQSKRRHHTGNSSVKLSEAEIKTIVRNEFPDAVIHKIKLETSDKYWEYEVKFTAKGLHGEMEIDPQTGIIIEREIKYSPA